MADKEKMAGLMVEGKARFDAADTDGDGRLNLDEWNAYAEKETAHALEKGWQTQAWDEDALAMNVEFYGLMNKISEDAEGISWEDLMWNMQNVGMVAHAKIKELDQ